MIKLEKRFAIEKCCGKDDTRPQLTKVYLDAENKQLLATTGNICAAVTVDCSDDEKSRYLTAAEVAAIRTAEKEADEDNQFPVNGVEKILSMKKEANLRIGVDLDLLHRVANAVGAKDGHIILHLSLKTAQEAIINEQCFLGPIFVTSEREDAEGAVMPRRV